eukprot:gene11933-5334_t
MKFLLEFCIFFFFCLVHYVKGQLNCPSCPSLNLPGRLWVTNKNGHSVSVISLRTGQHLISYPTQLAPHELTLSPNERLVATASYGNRPAYITIFNTETSFRRSIQLQNHTAVHGIKFIDDERLIITDEETKSVLIFNLKFEEIERVIDTSPSPCHLVIMDENMRNIAYCTDRTNGLLVVLDLEQGIVKEVKQSGKGAEGIDTKNNEIWVANRDEDTITIFEYGQLKQEIQLNNLNFSRQLNSSTFPIRVAFSDDAFRKVVIPNGVSGDATIFDAKTKQKISKISLKKPTEPSPFPCGVLLIKDFGFISNCEANTISIISLKANTVIGEITGSFLNENDGMIYTKN